MQNYQLLLEKEIDNIKSKGIRPTLLLHACCAPCCSYVLEYLHDIFDITLFFYNPNISPVKEYDFRAAELQRLPSLLGVDGVKTVVIPYNSEPFYNIASGMESLAEGGARCFSCYRLRLEESALYAKENGFDYFTTTLTISPHKNAEVINQIGLELADKYSLKYLLSDFKKNNGYKRSCELSRLYNLYRQDYCGCEFSKR